MAGPSGARVYQNEATGQSANGNRLQDEEVDPPQYHPNAIPSFSRPRQDINLDESNPPAYFKRDYHVAEIPPFRGQPTPRPYDPPTDQENADFPFHLPDDASAYFKFHANHESEDVILPFGSKPENPMYTLKWGNKRTLSKKYFLGFFRNNERKPGWFDAEKPLSLTRIHTHMEYVDFDFYRANGKKISFNGLSKTSMFEDRKGKSFVWPAAASDPGRYTWLYPNIFITNNKPWMYARLCRAEGDKIISPEHPVADVMIWTENSQFYHEKSYIRIPMREIIVGGSDRADQTQRMEDILIVAIAFAAGKMRFAYERKRKGSGGGGGTDTSAIASVNASIGAASIC